MAQIIANNEVGYLGGQMKHWAYNGLDCCVTREIDEVLEPRLDPTTRTTYYFEMACQSPAMAMMRRGVRLDAQAISAALKELEKEIEASKANCNKLIPAGKWTRLEKVAGKCSDGKNHKWAPKDALEAEKACEKCGQRRFTPAGFNPNSDDQCKELLYDGLGLAVQISRKTGKPCVDEDALDNLHKKYPDFRALIDGILETRGLIKERGVLNSRQSSDGRWRSSFNVGAPETGRWSSSKNHYGEGLNCQNITEKLRRVIIADPGMELIYADLEQAESRCVAYLAEDENYIAAHLAGDVHTYVCRMVWPNLPWTGDLKRDKEIANQPAPFSRLHHPYRRIVKEVQHGSNYGLKPFGLAMHAEIPLKDAEIAQATYFSEFPGIPIWQKQIKAQVKETHVLTTPLGRRREFFGRYWDEHVQRQAIAFVPQSMVADILNLALWRVWRLLDTQINWLGSAPSVKDPNRLWLLAQVHDAILAEIRKGDTETAQRVKELMEIPVEVNGRVMVIPSEVQTGLNWSKFNDKADKGPLNLGGMR